MSPFSNRDAISTWALSRRSLANKFSACVAKLSDLLALPAPPSFHSLAWYRYTAAVALMLCSYALREHVTALLSALLSTLVVACILLKPVRIHLKSTSHRIKISTMTAVKFTLRQLYNLPDNTHWLITLPVQYAQYFQLILADYWPTYLPKSTAAAITSLQLQLPENHTFSKMAISLRGYVMSPQETRPNAKSDAILYIPGTIELPKVNCMERLQALANILACKVFVFNLEGCGDSDGFVHHPKHLTLSLAACADQILQTHPQLQRLHLWGHSNGANILLRCLTTSQESVHKQADTDGHNNSETAPLNPKPSPRSNDETTAELMKKNSAKFGQYVLDRTHTSIKDVFAANTLFLSASLLSISLIIALPTCLSLNVFFHIYSRKWIDLTCMAALSFGLIARAFPQRIGIKVSKFLTKFCEIDNISLLKRLKLSNFSGKLLCIQHPQDTVIPKSAQLFSHIQNNAMLQPLFSPASIQMSESHEPQAKLAKLSWWRKGLRQICAHEHNRVLYPDEIGGNIRSLFTASAAA